MCTDTSFTSVVTTRRSKYTAYLEILISRAYTNSLRTPFDERLLHFFSMKRSIKINEKA